MPFYAVKRGRKTGVFETWKECEEQVKSYVGARYKKFDTEEEAESFVSAPHSPGKAPKSSDGDEKDSKGHKRSHDEAEASEKEKKEKSEKKQKKEDEKTEKKASGKVKVVYTDGCCFFNGKHGQCGGVGVYWGPDDANNLSEKLQDDKPTNHKAEITAATKAIAQAKKMGLDSLEIRTDSQFVIDCGSKWMAGWKKKGWKKSDGSEIKNLEELQEMDKAMEDIDVTWTRVKGQDDEDEGKKMAHKLSNEGARKVEK